MTAITTRPAGLASGPRRRLHDLVPAPRPRPVGHPSPARTPVPDGPAGAGDLLDPLGSAPGTDV